VTKRSAGLLMFRRRGKTLEVFLVHPSGPFWANKDLGAWSVPKGEYADGEDPLAAARREFEEETGMRPQERLIPLDEIKQPGGKLVKAWAFEDDFDPSKLHSNTFAMEWPKNSGIMQEFPEIDHGGWFPIEVARTKLLAGQAGFLDQLASKLGLQKNP
jgi:predicted NUDIX family NTP pyrophosphohydrolase